jgi:hypothetical protein
MGRIPVLGRVARRLVAVLVVVTLAGCGYSSQEPGLFGRSADPTTIAPPPATPQIAGREPNAARTMVNPDLPVVGEAVWTSADGLDIQVRIAVHALRRIPGATVLDWSVTPLRGPGLAPGDGVPGSVNLGLTRLGEDNVNVFLVDTLGRRVYRPLTSKSYPGLQSCLCTPLRVVERNLRIGQTQLLQVAYPELPDDQSTIDVDVATVPMFFRVPVTTAGLVPQAAGPVDLARPSTPASIEVSSPPFRYARGGQHFIITVDEVVASATFTSLRWTIQSLDDGAGLESASVPPFAEPAAVAKVYNPVSASGPVLTAASDGPRRALLMSTKQPSLSAPECLCSDLRLWASSLKRAEQQASVVTNLPPLPINTQDVSVAFAGLPPITSVRLTSASDGTFRSAAPVKRSSQTWTSRAAGAPAGWPVSQWPTPLPDTAELGGFRATVDRLVR